MEKSKFKVRDMVWSDIQERVAIIKGYNAKYDAYELDDGFMADEDDLEPLDKDKVKNQFLNELQCLLIKYCAEIDIGWNRPQDDDCVCLSIGRERLYYTKDRGITPENIFDYDKD